MLPDGEGAGITPLEYVEGVGRGEPPLGEGEGVGENEGCELATGELAGDAGPSCVTA